MELVRKIAVKFCRGIVKIYPFRYDWRRDYFRFRIDHISNPFFYKAFKEDFIGKYQLSQDLHGYSARKLWIDFLLCWFFIGAEPEDYFHFEFWRKNWAWRNHHTTRNRMNFFKKKVNDIREISKLDNKEMFNDIWSDYLRRNWCIPSKISKEQFEKLFREVDKVIIKELDGRGGHGIYTMDLKENLGEIYEELVRDNTPKIVEEYIYQKGFFHDINPSSLNTLRVTTFRTAEKTEVLSAGFRCGSSDRVVDNLHSGGFYFPIKLDTGVIEVGNNYLTRNVTIHPKTNVQIFGTVCPDWEKIKHFCIQAHALAPENLHWIGWDVCWSDGDLSMIEGNAGPGFNPLNDPTMNIWKKCCYLLNNLEDYPTRQC